MGPDADDPEEARVISNRIPWREHAAILRVDPVAAAIAAATALFHLATARGYGYFRDELYYLACAQHLDWGYVDHPPLVALIGAIVRNTVGTSLHALRLTPALCAGATVLVAAALARQMGGRRTAQSAAAVTVALAPVNLSLASFFSMNAIDHLIWALVILTATRLLVTDDRRLWLVFGALAGIGLENKLSVLFLGAGVGAGLVLAREWRHLKDPRLYLGGAVAALLAAPHLIWQVAHGWPTAEFVRNATENKNLALSPFAYLKEQILMMNPLALPLWLAGLALLLFSRDGRRWRTLGWAWPVAFIIMVAENGKPYYLAPIYPLLFAAGGLVLERALLRRPAFGGAAVALLAVSGLVLAPLAKPLLSEDDYVRYAAALGMAPGSDERKEVGRLPQFFADMHGWPELAEAVGAVAAALPADERARACVYGQNYGEAAAIDFFGPARGAPRAITGHNNYWLWGPRGCDGSVLILIGGDREDHEQVFEEVTEAGRFECTDCMPYEDDQMLWIARRMRIGLDEAWARTRHYD
jgi:hypothetical protein